MMLKLGLALLFHLLVVSAKEISSNEVTKLKKIGVVDSTEYYLSEETADPTTAKLICSQNSAKLVSFQTEEEFLNVAKKLTPLEKSTGDALWTSGISFSNATVEDRLLWTSNDEPEPFLISEFAPASDLGGNPSAAMRRYPMRKLSRNKRYDCFCNCTNPTPTPSPPIVCKKPRCDIQFPEKPCEHISPPKCEIDQLPKCNVMERNCTVECGACYIIPPRTCNITNNSTKPRCRLEMPKCDESPPVCRVLSPGLCHAVQDPCVQDDGDACKPIVKPCKNSCVDWECEDVQPPCKNETVCSSHAIPASNCRMEKRCRPKRSGGGQEDCEIHHVCTTPAPPPHGCTSRPSCPPVVSACSKPFDCTPEICQSNVHLCLPPKIRCPPVRTVCEQPKIQCDVPECSKEPEVICDVPEFKCDPPRIHCDPAKVQCSPSISTCDPPKLTCSEAEVTGCIPPTVNCESSTTCPITPPDGGGCDSCDCNGASGGNKFPQNMKRESMPTEVEIVEKTLCVAMKKELDFKWVLQSCNLKHKFICEKKKKGGFFKDFLGNMVIG